MMVKRKYILLAVGIALLLFALVGYIKSDARYYKTYLRENRLATPVQIFTFVGNKYKHDSCEIVHSNATPRHLMLNHKRLWCDEGSTVIATLCYYAGYDTRLVRVMNMKNVDNHTFLQVKENGAWKNYDFTFRAIEAPVDSIATIAGMKVHDLEHYNYPRFYNKMINLNYFVKQAALYFRGIKEDDFVN